MVGLLLHKFLPHDTYTVWKLGTRIRIDGALKGLDEDAHSMLPSWKYGHFSILVDAGKHTPTAVLVDHDKGTYTPIEVRRRLRFLHATCMDSFGPPGVQQCPRQLD